MMMVIVRQEPWTLSTSEASQNKGPPIKGIPFGRNSVIKKKKKKEYAYWIFSSYLLY